MAKVLLALFIPCLVWFLIFGYGVLVQIGLAVVVGLGCEAIALYWRKFSILPFIKDGSTLVAMVLLALCIPPYAPWWLVTIAAVIAILLAKHIYGGLGKNIFNPAMAGYAVVLISFPAEFALWATPDISWLLSAEKVISQPSWSMTLAMIFGWGDMLNWADAYSGATALAQLQVDNILSFEWLKRAWFWFNISALLGGVLLVWWRVITWHIPVAFLVSVTAVSLLFDVFGWLPEAGFMLHHFLGATMLGAFFIITDPVSAATSPKGRLIYAAFAGLMVVVIRTWGNYPDSIAFAVLLANLLVPILDDYCKPAIGNSQKLKH